MQRGCCAKPPVYTGLQPWLSTIDRQVVYWRRSSLSSEVLAVATGAEKNDASPNHTNYWRHQRLCHVSQVSRLFNDLATLWDMVIEKNMKINDNLLNCNVSGSYDSPLVASNLSISGRLHVLYFRRSFGQLFYICPQRGLVDSVQTGLLKYCLSGRMDCWTWLCGFSWGASIFTYTQCV